MSVVRIHALSSTFEELSIGILSSIVDAQIELWHNPQTLGSRAPGKGDEENE